MYRPFKYLRLLSVFFILLSPFLLCSQNWGYKKYSTADGLMSNQLDAIFIDSKGLLWIANGNGISRYNGKKFTHYLNDSILAPVNKINAFSIRELPDGGIFYSMKYGYVKISDKKKNYLDIYLSDTLSEENGVTNKDGIRYFKEGFVEFQKERVRNQTFDDYPENYKYPSNILCSNFGNVIYSFYNSDKDTRTLFLYENNTFKKIFDAVPFIMAGIFETSAHYFILPEKFILANPIIIINKKDLSIKYIRKNKSIPDITLLGNGYLDRNIFILPAEEGAFIINENKEQYFINDDIQEEIKITDRKKFYSSLYQPLHRYNNYIINGYRWIDMHTKKIHLPSIIKEEIKHNNYIIEVMPDEEGNIWYATFNGLFQLFPLPYQPLYEITEDRIGEVNDSIETNRFRCIKNLEKIEYCLNNEPEKLQILIPEIKDKFYKYEWEKDQVSPIYVQWLQSPVLKERLYPLLSYKKLIICQEYTRGLVIYHLNQTLDTAYYHLLNYSNGLLSNYVENIFVDKKENIWLITWDGIQFITYDDLLNENYEQSRKYSESWKLDMIPFMVGTDIYFTNGQMLYKIPTEKIMYNNKPPHVVIEKIAYKQNNNYIELQFKQDSTYELPYNFEELNIEFFGVCLSDGSKVKYKYILNNTTHYQNEGNIILSELSSGDHTIEIFASNNFNVWNNTPLRLYIHVHPPFWEKWWFRSLVLIIIITLIIIIIKKREYDLKKKQQELERLVHLRTKELAEKNKVIEQKNTEILDSIHYTKRLQQSSLPSESEVKKIFPDSFIIYMPKDIIAGDFYFSSEVKMNDGKKLYAVSMGDCTGHGVPGAFMSILLLAYMKQTLIEKDVNSPADALEFISKKIQKVLEYKNMEDEVKDSADMVFAVLDKETNRLRCACANNPIYIVKNNQLIEIPAQKRTVGYCDNKEPFTNHSVPIQKGDMIYLFSDGYADQFGRKESQPNKEKKFTRKRFKDTLLQIASLDIYKQREALIQIHCDWKKDLEQTDDICIVGIRI